MDFFGSFFGTLLAAGGGFLLAISVQEYRQARQRQWEEIAAIEVTRFQAEALTRVLHLDPKQHSAVGLAPISSQIAPLSRCRDAFSLALEVARIAQLWHAGMYSPGEPSENRIELEKNKLQEVAANLEEIARGVRESKGLRFWTLPLGDLITWRRR